MIPISVAGLIIVSCAIFLICIFGSIYFWERNKRSKSDSFYHTMVWCMLDYMWDHSDETELEQYAWHIANRDVAHDDEMRFIASMIEDARPGWYETFLVKLQERVDQDKADGGPITTLRDLL